MPAILSQPPRLLPLWQAAGCFRPPRRESVWLSLFRAGLGWLVSVCLIGGFGLSAARAQSVDLPNFSVSRQDGAVTLDFTAKLNLGKAAEEALQRGVPLYFVAQATVFRQRWYWRDDRVVRATRTWRVVYLPLTNTWRVSLGGLGQTARSAEEALAMASRASEWRIAEPEQLEAGERYYVELQYRLDADQLPRPMQLDLGVMSDWKLAVIRSQKLD